MLARPRILVPVGLTVALFVAACGGGAASPGTTSAPLASAPASLDASAPASAPASGSPAASSGAGVTVTAVDFAFEGVPAQVPSGTTLSLTNAGQEVHEMVVVRKLPTTTQTFEELLALPQEEALKLVQDIGFAFAEPGKTADQTITTGEPGQYLMVCFIPAGTTSLPSIDPSSSAAPSLGTGAPHFTLGMLKEFTVTE